MTEITEITTEQLERLDKSAYIVVDIRSALDYEYGSLESSVNIEEKELRKSFSLLDDYKDRLLVICCKSGMISNPLAEELREKGYNAVNLVGGYYGWLREQLFDTDKSQSARDSLLGEFNQTVWQRFKAAIDKYELVQSGDRIAVCISGGKDSMLMAKLFSMLKDERSLDFEVRYLVMDPGYAPVNRETIEKNARSLGIPIEVFETNIFNYVYGLDKHPCYICARMRRGHLYSRAKQMGCNKIALGHHYDDVIETILMGMIYGGQIQTMMPKLHSSNFEGMELIRPLYLIREDEIKRWRDYNELTFIQCACRFTDTCTTCNPTGTGSKRQEVKHLIAELMQTNPKVEQNIFESIENVNLDKVLRWRAGTEEHYFDN